MERTEQTTEQVSEQSRVLEQIQLYPPTNVHQVNTPSIFVQLVEVASFKVSPTFKICGGIKNFELVKWINYWYGPSIVQSTDGHQVTGKKAGDSFYSINCQGTSKSATCDSCKTLWNSMRVNHHKT